MISPCVHPRCDDGNGNPRLTNQTMCDPCRQRVQQLLEWIVNDYARLKATMPKPIGTGTKLTGKPMHGPSGHPAEWASDMCSQIALVLNEAEDALRDMLGDEPAAHPHSPEPSMVRNAFRYLTDRIDSVCTFDGARSTVQELGDLHHEVRSRTGLTRFQQRLPVPCPTCDVCSLIRFTGHIVCESCGRIIREEDYGMLSRIAADAALDDLIRDYDTRKSIQELA